MKKILGLIILLITIPSISFATEEIIEDQLETLDLSTFIAEGEKYTKDVFPEIDIQELITQSFQGKIDKGILYKAMLSILGKEVVASITMLGSILAIIIVHSILKSIVENLGNDSTARNSLFHRIYINSYNNN